MPEQPGYRSPWARNVGGSELPTVPAPSRPGYRSLLWYPGGGATKPPSRGVPAGPRSMLAFWIGGANFHYIPSVEPIPPPYFPGDPTGGIPYRKHHGGHVRRDDEEIIEFLRIWVTWNDVE